MSHAIAHRPHFVAYADGGSGSDQVADTFGYCSRCSGVEYRIVDKGRFQSGHGEIFFVNHDEQCRGFKTVARLLGSVIGFHTCYFFEC